MAMKKIFLTLAAAFLALFACMLPVQAASTYVVDQAGILNSSEQAMLEKQAADLSEQYQCGVYIVTVSDFTQLADYVDIRSFAEAYYKQNGLGMGSQQSGILLVLSMAERDYSLIAYGNGNNVLTDYGREQMLDNDILPKLSDDDYYGGFSAYLDTTGEYLKLAAAGTPFDVNSDPAKLAMERMIKIGVVIGVPLIAALIVVLVLRKQMKTAGVLTTAGGYIVKNGVNMRTTQDQFLYRNVVRVPIPRNVSRGGGGGGGGTTISSSGFSGSSGKF